MLAAALRAVRPRNARELAAAAAICLGARSAAVRPLAGAAALVPAATWGRVTCAVFTRLPSGWRHFYTGQSVKKCAIFSLRPALYASAAPWVLWWLPGGSLVSFALATYVDRDIATMLRDVEGLESLKYDYKKV